MAAIRRSPRSCADAAADSDVLIAFPPYAPREPDVAALARAADSGVPLVLLDREMPELAGRTAVAMVDYEAGFRRQIAMLRRTPRRIALLVAPEHPPCTGLRPSAVACGLARRMV